MIASPRRWAWAMLTMVLPLSGLAKPPAPELAVVKRMPPEYPRLELCRGVQGKSEILVKVDPNGAPVDVSVSRSSGSANLDRAALDSMRGWLFTPTGETASGYIDIDFRMDSDTILDADCSSARFSLFGGLVGATPQYQPGTLEVTIHSFPADADELEVIVQDANGQTVQSAKLRYQPQDNGTRVVKFEALGPGPHSLLLIAAGKERGRASFVVQQNGSVETTPQP